MILKGFDSQNLKKSITKLESQNSLGISDHALRLWDIGVDLDFPPEWLALQVKMLTGTEMNQ
jgi:hypothetical protein